MEDKAALAVEMVIEDEEDVPLTQDKGRLETEAAERQAAPRQPLAQEKYAARRAAVRTLVKLHSHLCAPPPPHTRAFRKVRMLKFWNVEC